MRLGVNMNCIMNTANDESPIIACQSDLSSAFVNALSRFLSAAHTQAIGWAA